MKSFFNATFFADNRTNLLKKTKSKLLVIPAHQTQQRNADNVQPFRQESNFWYLTGINEPDYILVLSTRETFLIVPKKDTVEAVFDGEASAEHLTKISGIQEIMDEREGWQKLSGLLQKHKKVGALLPMNQKYFNVAMNPARKQLITKMRRRAPGTQIEDIRMSLAQMRMIKQPQELRALQKAIDITNQTLAEVFTPNWFATYDHEYQVEADITAGFRRRGAAGHAFTPIVASGKNTCTIHSIANNSPLQKNSILLLDIGAEVENYAADISRVVPIGSKFSTRQQQVFDAVIDVYNYALTLLKPVQNYMEYEQKVETYMGKTLVTLGVIDKPTRKNIRKFYPHRTSHFLGLDPHDAGDYSKDLQENMVITVEPGIYIPAESIGIRIEEDVLITKTGYKVLSGALPLRPPLMV